MAVKHERDWPLPRTLYAVVEEPELETVAWSLCEELAAGWTLACVWVGVKAAGDEFETISLVGDGRTAAAFRESEEPWIGGLSSGPALPAVVTGKPTLIDPADEALKAWRTVLEADAVGLILGVPIALSGHRLGICLLFAQGDARRPEAEWLQLGDDIRRLFEHFSRLKHQQLLAEAVMAAGNSIFITDREARIVFANPAFATLTGYSEGEVLGRNPRLLKSGSQSKRYYRGLWQHISSGKVWTGETIDRDKFGYRYAINQTISPIFRGGRISHYLSVHEDVSRRRAQRREEERERPADERSGLLNATAFLDRIAAEVRAAESAERGFYVVSLVLRSYPIATEGLDSVAARRVLQVIGERLRAQLGRQDAAAHAGDGDFALLLASMSSRDDAGAVVERIIQALREPLPSLGESLYFAPQYGIAEYPVDATAAEDLWRLAEDALVIEETDENN